MEDCFGNGIELDLDFDSIDFDLDAIDLPDLLED